MPRARCSYREGQRRCPKAGRGNPPLCAAHEEALYDDEAPDVMDEIEDRMMNAADRLVSGVRNLFESFLQEPQQPIEVNVPRRPRPATRRAPPPRRPPPPRAAPVAPAEDPRDVLGFPRDAKLTQAEVKKRQRALAALLHPDKGGSNPAMQRVNAATKALLSQLGQGG